MPAFMTAVQYGREVQARAGRERKQRRLGTEAHALNLSPQEFEASQGYLVRLPPKRKEKAGERAPWLREAAAFKKRDRKKGKEKQMKCIQIRKKK